MGGVRAAAAGLLAILAIGGPGAVASSAAETSGVVPGAIEPLPVNKQLEEEFWAKVAEYQRRGAAAVPVSEPWFVLLVPSLRAGSVGWCAIVRGTAFPSTRCPVSPLDGPRIIYEAWEAAAPGTRGFAITAGPVNGVTVNGGRVAFPTLPVPGLSENVGAALVAIPAPLPSQWPDQIDGLLDGWPESEHHGWGAPPLSPSLTLATTQWSPPQVPPPGPCRISSTGLRRLHPLLARGVTTLTPLAGVAGRGLESCADTDYAYARTSFDAALLLDAAQPGAVAPVPLPNAAPVHRHPRLFSAPGANGQILGERVGDAWLVVEGGTDLSQRETVLEHLRASPGS